MKDLLSVSLEPDEGHLLLDVQLGHRVPELLERDGAVLNQKWKFFVEIDIKFFSSSDWLNEVCNKLGRVPRVLIGLWQTIVHGLPDLA